VDPRNFPEFAKHYWLTGSDSGAVLAFLSPEKIAFLENTKFEGVGFHELTLFRVF